MSQISDDAIKKDIYSTLKMWERFNSLEEEQRTHFSPMDLLQKEKERS